MKKLLILFLLFTIKNNIFAGSLKVQKNVDENAIEFAQAPSTLDILSRGSQENKDKVQELINIVERNKIKQNNDNHKSQVKNCLFGCILGCLLDSIYNYLSDDLHYE